MTKLFNFLQKLNLKQSILFVLVITIVNFLLIKAIYFLPSISIIPTSYNPTIQNKTDFGNVVFTVIFFLISPFIKETIFRYKNVDLLKTNKIAHYFIHNSISFFAILSIVLYPSNFEYSILGVIIYILYFVLFVGKSWYTESEEVSEIKYDKFIISASLAYALFHIRNFEILNLNSNPNKILFNLMYLSLFVLLLYIFSILMFIIRNRYKYGLLTSGLIHLGSNIFALLLAIIWK